MDEKPETAGGRPDLAAALRRARIENAERADAIAELREIELGRLALLESALQTVVRQAPPGVDLFDLTLSRGDRPRVFLDMVAFIEMARDRRTYRFFQDTLYGRVAIAESPKIDTIVAACTNYVARRLVERERALAASVPAADGEDLLAPAAPDPTPGEPGPSLRGSTAPRPVVRGATALTPGGPRGLAGPFLRALGLVLTAVGAVTLAGAVGFAAWLGWSHQFGALWSRLMGAAPI